MNHRCLLLLCILVPACTSSDKDSPLDGNEDIVFAEGGGFGSGSGSGMLTINISEFSLPACLSDELLTFDGDSLLCNKIPERKCICPGPIEGSGDMPTPPVQPPGGCTVFEPPEGGALICLLSDQDNVIYCSVYCDNEHEFSTTPLNPYFCGTETRFEWMDFTGVVHAELPKCTGFRYTLRPLHPLEFYLPVPCNALFEDQADSDKAKTDFCDLISFFTREDCDSNDVTVQCPPISDVTTTAQMPAVQDPQFNP